MSPSQADIIRRAGRGTEHATRALVVRTIPYGEADIVVGLFTEGLGQVSALARQARSPKRRNLCIEPMHTLDVVLRDHAGASLTSLLSASIGVPRTRLIAALERLDAAGSALRWVRQASPVRAPEPDVWNTLHGLLDALDQRELSASPRALLAVSGLLFLRALGYGLEFDRCVVCSKPCPHERSAYLDAVRGGLVCRRCGGSGITVSGLARQRFKVASKGVPALEEQDVAVVITLVEIALAAHAQVRPPNSSRP